MKRTLLFVFCALAAALALYVAMRPTSERAGSDASGSRAATYDRSAPVDAVAPSMDRAPASAPAATANERKRRGKIIIVDKMRQPIAGAQLLLLPRHARYVASGEATLVGASDTEGMLIVQDSVAHEMHGRDAVVRADGYTNRVITSEIETGGSHVVQLEQARSVDFECLDTSGAPVEGAVVALSADRVLREQSSLDDDQIIQSIPGSDALTAIFTGRSDSAGRVRLRGLPAQTMALHVEKHGMGPVDKPTTIDTSIEDRICIHFGVLFASILRVEGDEIIGARMQGTGTDASAFLGSSAAERAKAYTSLRAQFPDALILVGMPVDGRPFAVKNRLLLRNAGLQEYETTATKLTIPPVVESFRPPNAIVASSKSAEVVVVVIDADGLAVPEFAPWRITYKASGSSMEFGVKIEIGKPTRLPLGHYSVESFSSLLTAHLEAESFEIREGIEPRVEIRLRGSWVPCRVQVIEESTGRSIGGCSVRVGSTSGHGDLVTLDGGKKDLWLPVGKAGLQLVDPTYTATQSQFDVLADIDRSKPQEIVLKAKRL